MTSQPRPPEHTPAVLPDQPDHRRALAVAIATTTVLILLVVAGAALTGDWGFDPDPLPTATIEALPVETAPPPTLMEPRPPNTIAQRTLTTVLLVAAGILAAFLLYRIALWVRRTLLPWLATRRDRPLPVPAGPVLDLAALPLTELRTAATHAETLLQEGEHSADAIIAAWLALQDAAERSGATRAPAQTPTEFTVAVLAATPATPAAVTELLGLYHLARFARTEMTPAQVAAAGTALRQLIDDFSPTSPTATAATPTAPALDPAP